MMVKNYLDILKKIAKPGDEVVFYFSGHGGNSMFGDGVKDENLGETEDDPKDEPLTTTSSSQIPTG